MGKVMDHCEACVQEKGRRQHRAKMRRWVVDKRRMVHARYMKALAVLADVHARPHKWSLEHAEKNLLESGDR